MNTQVIVKAVKIGLGIWLALIVFSVLNAISLAWFFTARFEGYYTFYPSAFLGVGLAIVCTLVTGWTFRRLVLLNGAWILGAGGCTLLYVGLMMFVSAPHWGDPFDMPSGKPQRYYRNQYGTIFVAAPGAKVGPHGEEIKPFDRTIAAEYERQEGKPESSNDTLWQMWFERYPKRDRGGPFSEAPGDNLIMWVKWIDLAPDRTILHFAVQGKNGQSGRFYGTLEKRRTYLIDELHEPHEFWGEDCETMREVRVEEIYSCTSTFGPVPADRKQLKLYHSNYLPLTLDHLLPTAHRVEALLQKGLDKAWIENDDLWTKNGDGRWFRSGYGGNRSCEFRVDALNQSAAETELTGRCKGPIADEVSVWPSIADQDTHLVDDQGRLSTLLRGDVDARELRAGEILQFKLFFRPIGSGAKTLNFFRSGYPKASLTPLLSQQTANR